MRKYYPEKEEINMIDKESIIKFLKPSWKKITVTVILILFLSFPNYFGFGGCAPPGRCRTFVEFSGMDIILTAFLNPAFAYVKLQTFWMYYLLNIIVSYTLSCLVISALKFKIRKS